MYLKRFFGEVTSPHPCVNCRGDETLDFGVRTDRACFVATPVLKNALKTHFLSTR